MTEHDEYRLLMVLPRSSLLLVDRERRPPRVAIPSYSRPAEQLTRTVEEKWGFQSLVIDCLSADTLSPLAILELRSAVGELPTGVLIPTEADGLEGRDISEAEINQLKATLAVAAVKPGPFSRIGWIDDAIRWIESMILGDGWTLTGRFQQLNAGDFFNLTRFETTGPALWFKAVGEPNLREFSISVALAKLFPGYVPKLIATRPSWNAWLTREGRGSHPDKNSEMALWERAVTTLAHLQMASMEKATELISVGCRDLRLPVLLDLVDPFLDRVDVLMKTQPKIPPAVLSRQELMDLGAEIKNACVTLSEMGLPDTLGHLDFNPGNILVSSDSCIFLDWAEACISHPFLTLEYLLEHFRRMHPENVALQSQLISAYSQVWNSIVSPKHISEALKLTPLVAVFAYAVGNEAWSNLDRQRDTKLAGYFRGLARRMHRETALLEGRRELCLN